MLRIGFVYPLGNARCRRGLNWFGDVITVVEAINRLQILGWAQLATKISSFNFKR